MKRNSSLTFIALVLLAACKTQHRIPYNADRIVINAPYPDSALYESAITYLDQEEYVIDKADRQRGQIVTDYKTLPNRYIAYRMILSVKDNKITVRGEGEAQVLGSRMQNVSLYNGARAGTFQKRGFKIVDDLGRRLSRRLPNSTYAYGNGNHLMKTKSDIKNSK